MHILNIALFFLGIFSVFGDENCEDLRNEILRLSSLLNKFDIESSSLDFLNQDKEQLQIISRNKWLAVSPSAEIFDLKLPLGKVVITHTATSECFYQVVFIALHFTNNF